MNAPSCDTRGKLIVFEGIDGTGKSTQIAGLRRFLEGRGIAVVQSYEPTNGKWGRIVRESASKGRLPVDEEVDLFLKDRRQHVEELILPALSKGQWILLDRYYISMMAYQGARGLDVEQIRKLNEEFAPVPDLVIWLDIPVEEAHRRIGDRGGLDSFETEEMLNACRRVFAGISDEWMARVDGMGSPGDVLSRVVSVVSGRFGL